MNDQDSLTNQVCVLRLNLQCHCEGCKQKVKKNLLKIMGVRKVVVDAEQGKVTVWGLVDPRNLIQHLEKGGKHAELWGGENGEGYPHQRNKGPKNRVGPLSKAQKAQELQQHFNGPRSLLPVNVAAPGMMGNGGDLKKKHGVIKLLLEGLLLKTGIRTGIRFKGRYFHGGRGNGAGDANNRTVHGKNKSKGGSDSNGRGRTDDGFGWSSKVEDNFEQVPKLDEINVVDKEMIGNRAALMGKFQALEMAGGGGYKDFRYKVTGQGNPYGEQEMANMMMVAANHQREKMQAQAGNYGQPPVTDQFTHIFSDENTASCTIM